MSAGGLHRLDWIVKTFIAPAVKAKDLASVALVVATIARAPPPVGVLRNSLPGQRHDDPLDGLELEVLDNAPPLHILQQRRCAAAAHVSHAGVPQDWPFNDAWRLEELWLQRQHTRPATARDAVADKQFEQPERPCCKRCVPVTWLFPSSRT